VIVSSSPAKSGRRNVTSAQPSSSQPARAIDHRLGHPAIGADAGHQRAGIPGGAGAVGDMNGVGDADRRWVSGGDDRPGHRVDDRTGHDDAVTRARP
jgi:hypothetical protein